MRTLIHSCKIVSPDQEIPEGFLVLEDGWIVEVSPGPAPEGNFDKVINGKDRIAVPGFIDIHFHGRSNFDFCDGTAEAFSVIGKGKLQDGVTSFLATSLSVSTEDLRNLCHQAEIYKKEVKEGSTLL